MTKIKDKGALIAALVAIALSLVSWMRADAGRTQQLADLQANVQHIEQQMQRFQADFDQYLYQHDGH
jgi:uncharacterized protein YxeA